MQKYFNLTLSTFCTNLFDISSILHNFVAFLYLGCCCICLKINEKTYSPTKHVDRQTCSVRRDRANSNGKRNAARDRAALTEGGHTGPSGPPDRKFTKAAFPYPQFQAKFGAWILLVSQIMHTRAPFMSRSIRPTLQSLVGGEGCIPKED